MKQAVEIKQYRKVFPLIKKNVKCISYNMKPFTLLYLKGCKLKIVSFYCPYFHLHNLHPQKK